MKDLIRDNVACFNSELAAMIDSKASEAFGNLHGVKKIDVFIATCGSRKRVRTWEHLESSLLATFRSLHFDLPRYNKKKGSLRFAEDVTLFKQKALQRMILQFSN